MLAAADEEDCAGGSELDDGLVELEMLGGIDELAAPEVDEELRTVELEAAAKPEELVAIELVVDDAAAEM